MSPVDAATAILVILGALFCLVAAIGLLRMPDLYQRMQSATKAGTLGSACAVLGVAIHFQSTAIAVESVLVILFLFATAPIASHLIARAAFGIKVPLWDRTVRDDLSRDRDNSDAGPPRADGGARPDEAGAQPGPPESR